MKIITIGRNQENNNIVINDEKVSRNHLQLVQDDQGNCFATDLGSTNGTFVNGQRISGKTLLHSGDELRIGNTVLPWRDYIAASAKAGAAGIPPKKSGHDSSASSKSTRRKGWIWVIIGVAALLLVVGIVLCVKSCSAPKEDNETTEIAAPTSAQDDLEKQKAKATTAYLKAKNEADSLKALEQRINDSLQMKNLSEEKRKELEQQKETLGGQIAKKTKEIENLNSTISSLQKSIEEEKEKTAAAEGRAKNAEGRAKTAEDNLSYEKEGSQLKTEMIKILNSWNELTAKNFYKKKWGEDCKLNEAKNKITEKFDGLNNQEKKKLINNMKEKGIDEDTPKPTNTNSDTSKVNTPTPTNNNDTKGTKKPKNKN